MIVLRVKWYINTLYLPWHDLFIFHFFFVGQGECTVTSFSCFELCKGLKRKINVQDFWFQSGGFQKFEALMSGSFGGKWERGVHLATVKIKPPLLHID